VKKSYIERVKIWEDERKALAEKNRIAKESGFKRDWILKSIVGLDREDSSIKY
jgi:hypothetical protein